VVIRRIQKLLEYAQRLFLYALLGVPVVCIGSTAYALGGVAPVIEDIIWDSCLWAIQLLGPTFMKLAQWASTRPDLYPPALIKRLESLQDRVKVDYSIESVERTLRLAFGDDWTDLRIEPKPIGAGCVAQVFKGSLIDKKTKKKQDVAIKLIHPHVEKMIKTDMELLATFASFIDRYFLLFYYFAVIITISIIICY
jgi:predicted unusual protein kinase regulating ubiquinone biosynthesis (AarF/ABC1/UbiB family)